MTKKSQFTPAWWLPGPHLQTLWPALVRSGRVPQTRRERTELPDGDFVDLDWGDWGDASAPIVIILHGLQGSMRSHYVQRMFRALKQQRLRAVLMYFRGCSGTPNRLARTYHCGDTADFDHIIESLRKREPGTPIAAVGYSLGGNVLLKWLGEQGASASLDAAAAISVPFTPALAAKRLELGFSRVYQKALLRSLRRTLQKKFQSPDTPFDVRRLKELRNFWLFDEHVTAPLHGFASAAEYYARSGCREYLKAIRVPTLIVHSKDDPFMSPDAVPTEDELSSHVTLDLSSNGGHVGFVGGVVPLLPEYWLERRILQFLANRIGEPVTRPDSQGAVL